MRRDREQEDPKPRRPQERSTAPSPEEGNQLIFRGTLVYIPFDGGKRKV
jgi:hypothetical protein